MTSFQPEVWVDRAATAVAFYVEALGAAVVHQVGSGEDVVAQLAVGDAVFWVGGASAEMGRFSPREIRGATGRILMVVDDPDRVLARAVAAGATELSPVAEEHGWRVGRVRDPFGHEWEIGCRRGGCEVGGRAGGPDSGAAIGEDVATGPTRRRSMTSKTDFTDEEWARLKRAPLVAGMGISLADPGGPIEALKETSATLKSVFAAATDGSHGELVRDVAGEVESETRQQHKNPIGGFKPTKGATAGVEILDELREVNRIVTEKASPEDAAAFRAWLIEAAQAAANAAKEGGFLGWHAVRVSEGEQRMLDSLGEALAAPA